MAFSPASSRSPSVTPGDVVPYRMHVSQKYIDLTKQKLELTRLPREPHPTRHQVSGIAKADLERLVDHWTDEYSWRAQESYYNDRLPQYRMLLHGTRIHFVHRRSMSTNATPLLFLHGWPESFIAISNMIDALCDPVRTPPRGDEDSPAFHVVAPSIPGFGFSDQVAEDGNNLFATAEIFDALMKSLGYSQYIVHGTAWGFKIGRRLALTHSESCIGLHTANIENVSPSNIDEPSAPPVSTVQAAQSGRTQTISYALCDSPAGLLAYIVDAIGPALYPSPTQSNPWTSTTLVNWAMLHWLPGPEVALRWLDNSAPMTHLLWTSFSNVPLAISQYGDPSTAQSAPGWTDQFHTIAMVRQRVGNVRFPAWERPAEIVQDIRDLARLLRPQDPDFVTYDMYTAGFDQTQY